MASTLSPEQINSALLTLRAWSQQPWSDEDAVVWRAVLRNYRPGELGDCLGKWQRTANGRYRPTPGDLAQFLDRPANPSPYKEWVRPVDEPVDRDAGLKALSGIRSILRHDPTTQTEPQGAT